ncbi:MAG: Fis family transcriptional regulator [Myxococcales bacterium]|nr:Fis family transcriptional regulator [Myxococcales bacterium]
MAFLVDVKNDGQKVNVGLFKPITTLGAAADNDVVIPSSELPSTAAHIHFDGTQYTLSTVSRGVNIQVHGKKIRKTQLQDGDVFSVGGMELMFRKKPLPASNRTREEVAPEAIPTEAYRGLVSFSQKLAHTENVESLFETLMDEVLHLTGAQKGFLVLSEHNNPKIQVARNFEGESLNEAVSQMSDTIVKQVLDTQKPLLVQNALNDTHFNSSTSVINLQLTSVMCVPLLYAQKLLGVLYVGNQNTVKAFDEAAMEVLALFATQSGLLVQNALDIDTLQKRTSDLEKTIASQKYGQLVGASNEMNIVFSQIDRVAPTDVTVLVLGATGTGKELIAREIHQRSRRQKGPFEVINCGAIPENLLESELFGHVKGAFTGATQTRQGRFAQADGGTLFLDEIGEMPFPLQAKLLRVLQDQMVTKVGDTKPQKVDIRVLAATHRNLEEMVAKNEFREDLYYRLNVIQLHLPPLAERGDDILVLAQFLLEKYASEYGQKVNSFSPKAKNALLQYGWPGNVRQLENKIKRAVVLCDNKTVKPEDLDFQNEDFEAVLPLNEAIENFRRRYINEALTKHQGNRTQTAKALGVDPRTIFRHLETERQ